MQAVAARANYGFAPAVLYQPLASGFVNRHITYYQSPDDWDLGEGIPEPAPRRIVHVLAGGLNETFTEKFKLALIKFGTALGAEPDVALEACLSFVFHDACEHKSKLLRMATPDGGGLITRISDASTAACLRLAQRFPAKGGSSEVPAEQPIIKRRTKGRPVNQIVQKRHAVIRSLAQLEGEEYCAAIRQKLSTPLSWQQEHPPCSKDYLQA